MKYRNAMRRFGAKIGGAALGVAMVPGLALAQTTGVDFDTTEVLAIVTSARDFIIGVGLAVLALIMVAKGVKWARKAG